MQDIQARLAHVEHAVAALARTDGVKAAAEVSTQARYHALEFVVRELAERCGVEGEKFDDYLKRVTRWHHQQLLQKAEALNPSMAAELDNRKPDELEGADELPPPLFPE